MRHEIGLVWKEFRYSAKRSLTVILAIAVVAGVIAVSTFLGLVIYLLFYARPLLGKMLMDSLIKSGLTTAAVSDIIYFVLLLFLISSFVKGAISSSFGLVLSRADENVVVPSPISPRSLYIAKKLKGLMVHVLIVATILLAVFPLILQVGFQGFGLVFLFIAFLAMMEICGLTENISYCASRALRNRRHQSGTWALTILAFLAVFIAGSPLIMLLDGNASEFLAYLYPPYMFSQMILLSPSLNIVLGVCTLSGETIIFFLVASIVAKSGLRTWASLPRLSQTRSNFIGIRRNKLTWKIGKKSGTRLILAKDFWTTLRNPLKFFIPMGTTIALLIFAFLFQTVFVLPTKPAEIQLTGGLLLLSTYLVTICILSPAWDSFAGERRTFFILRSSPIQSGSIIGGKYLLALLQSAIFTAPIIGAISLVLPHAFDILLVALEVGLVLMVSNSVGILVSASYPPAYRGMGPPPFLILLGLPLLCVTLTMIIPILLALSYGNASVFVPALSLVLAYVYLVSRFCLRKASESFTKLQGF